MKYAIILIFAVMTMASCCKNAMPQSSTDTRDSTYREHIETIRYVDRYIPVPVEVRKTVVPADSTSILATSLARSIAELRNGMLFHSIENLPENAPVVSIPVVDTKDIEYRDRIVIKKEPYPVMVPLTKWQKFRMDIGGWALGGLVFLTLGFVLKKFVFR